MRCLIAAVLLSLQSQAGPSAPAPDKPLRVALAPQEASTPWLAQLLGDLDRSVHECIDLNGTLLPARVDDQGRLELDVRNDGKARTISKRETVTVTLKGEGDRPKTLTVRLEVRKRDDGQWVYRNLTHFRLTIAGETFWLADANGNGRYDDAGKDGLAWEGQAYLFPLPGAAERWCSATTDFAGIDLGGPLGERPAVKGKPLATTLPAALPILKAVNEERVRLGLAPRPEDPALSADLQKHCRYMALNNKLGHPEEPGKPGYSKPGHESGMRSILSQGTPAADVAAGMVDTYFHRQDVIRPGTLAFGVGYEGVFGGIDGRTSMAPAPETFWPVLCPAPGQTGVRTTFRHERPEPLPNDPEAGFPITAYFGTERVKLLSHSLKMLVPGGGPGTALDCHVFDPQTGVRPDLTKYQRVVCLIPKDLLKLNAEYEVTLQVDVAGKPWKKAWRFSTSTPKAVKAPGSRMVY